MAQQQIKIKAKPVKRETKSEDHRTPSGAVLPY